MQIHHIRYFLAVCNTLNFTKAAEQSNVSQPALSRAINQLELEVGGLLLRRERNLTHLTDLGNLMKPHFEKIIEGLGDIKTESKRFLTNDSAKLKLGVMCTIGPTRFAGILNSFAKDSQGITIQCDENALSNVKEKLESGEIEIALLASPESLQDQFNCQMLYRERFVVAFPPGHRFSKMNTVSFAETHDENYLDRTNCEYVQLLTDLTDESGAVHRTVYQSEREDWIQNLVLGGMGICFLPEFSVVAPGVQTRPLSEPEVWRDVCIASKPGRRFSEAAKNFIKSARAMKYAESQFTIKDAFAES
jgi:LysR family transcriptional regulator, hydrogen peroxide-inducible genes activator